MSFPEQKCQESELVAKEFFGCVPSPKETSCPTSPLNALGLEGNLKLEKEDISTGRLLLGLREKAQSVKSNKSLVRVPTLKSRRASLRTNMSGRKTPELKEPNLNLEPSLSGETRKLIGKQCGEALKKGTLKRSRRTLELCLIAPCKQLPRVMSDLLQWKEESMFTGELHIPASPIEPGQKQVQKLTLRIQDPNFGVVTSLKITLLSMNFEVSPMSNVGGIDVAHLLRWFDRYAVRVEIKGSSRPLAARNIWITSNINPEQWYPELDNATWNALARRMNIVEFTETYVFPE